MGIFDEETLSCSILNCIHLVKIAVIGKYYMGKLLSNLYIFLLHFCNDWFHEKKYFYYRFLGIFTFDYS